MSVVSHTGHSSGVHKQPPSQDDQGGTRDWFSLDDQLSHKLAFLWERAKLKRSLYIPQWPLHSLLHYTKDAEAPGTE